MQETFSMTIDQLSSFAEMVVNRTLESLNLKRKTITLSEINKLYGPTIARMARQSLNIQWFPMGESNKCGLECFCSEFERWLTTKGLSIYSK